MSGIIDSGWQLLIEYYFSATSQLCSNIISMLNTTTNAVLQLHSRLKHSDETSGSRNNNLMLKELENAVIMTQNMLTKITNK